MPDNEIHLTVVGPGYEWDWSADSGRDAARAAAALREYAGIIGAAVSGAWPISNVVDQIARIGRDFPEFPAPQLIDLTDDPVPEQTEGLEILSIGVGTPVPALTMQENPNGQPGSNANEQGDDEQEDPADKEHAGETITI